MPKLKLLLYCRLPKRCVGDVCVRPARDILLRRRGFQAISRGGTTSAKIPLASCAAERAAKQFDRASAVQFPTSPAHFDRYSSADPMTSHPTATAYAPPRKTETAAPPLRAICAEVVHRLPRGLSTRHVLGRPRRRPHRRRDRAAAGDGVRDQLRAGAQARGGAVHRHRRGVPHLAAGRQPRADRRAHRRVHAHPLPDRPEARLRRPGHRDRDGRRHPDRSWASRSSGA